MCRDRRAAIDDAGPQLNAVIELNPDALKEAEARDAERKAGRVRSPLHGIPVLLKDNIDATPMVNSAGNMPLPGVMLTNSSAKSFRAASRSR